MATREQADPELANLQAMLAQQDALVARMGANMASLIAPMDKLQETAGKASGGMDKLTKGLIGWGVAAHAVGTGITALTSMYMGQVAQMRIAQGKLSQGFAMQAQNRGAALTAIGAIPFVGGPAADFLHAWRNERSGSAVNIAVAGLLEGSYGRQRGISDQLSMGLAGGALEQKYRYNPEMLDYQKNLLGLRPAEGNIQDMRNTLAERKAAAESAEGEYGGRMGRVNRQVRGNIIDFLSGGLTQGGFSMYAQYNSDALEEKAKATRALYETASGQYGPQIAGQTAQVAALKAQAYESYRQNFYGGMGTTSFADWRSSGISSATMGGPGADILVSGVELTNTLLAQIVENTKGFNETAGVRK
jgi:hypothetical protein